MVFGGKKRVTGVYIRWIITFEKYEACGVYNGGAYIKCMYIYVSNNHPGAYLIV